LGRERGHEVRPGGYNPFAVVGGVAGFIDVKSRTQLEPRKF
jgi:hypothetical protein